MNILIADSGSTKTDWALVDREGKVVCNQQTQGLNPFHMGDQEIQRVLEDDLQLSCLPDEIYFYGSGVTQVSKGRLADIMRSVFSASSINLYGDMLGAARALLGREAGVACILGTGANSCLYDGKGIVLNTPPLGYVLGDEGSGAVLGKLFLNGIFKGSLPSTLKEAYLTWSGLDYPSIINKVYREPLANRYLASIAPFISQAILRGKAQGAARQECEAAEALDALVRASFEDFYEKNVTPYMAHLGAGGLLGAAESKQTVKSHALSEAKDIKIGFVGSIAHYFEPQLRSVFESAHHLYVADIMKAPMEGLVRYHTPPS